MNIWKVLRCLFIIKGLLVCNLLMANEVKFSKYTSDSIISTDDLLRLDFELLDKNQVNIANTSKYHYINFSKMNVRDKYIYLSFFQSPEVILYKYSDEGRFKGSDTLGYNVSTSELSNNIQGYLFELDNKTLRSTYVIRARTPFSYVSDIHVGTFKQLLTNINAYSRVSLFFFSCVLIMFFYNIILYFVSGLKEYLWYTLFILFNGFIQLSLKGFSYTYIWGNSRVLSNYSFQFIVPLTFIFGTLFMIKITRGIDFSKRITRIFLYSILCASFMSTLVFIFSESLGHNIQAIIASIWGGCSIAFLTFLYIKKSKIAGVVLIAQVLYQLSITVEILTFNGLGFEFNWITASLIEFGAVIEMVLLSFALNYNYKLISRQRDIAQNRLLEIEKEHRIELRKKVEVRTEHLERALIKNSVLLREVHHRVKNNLQIISSLLNLQIDNIKDPESIHVIVEAKNRIQSMALVHQKMYGSTNENQLVELHEYITSLTAFVDSSLRLNGYKVNIITNEICTSIDTTISIGLIINELLTNTFKHANIISDGVIDITFSLETENKIGFLYSDSGTTADLEKIMNGDGLGMNIVKMLVEQMDGHIQVFTSPKTMFQIELNTILK